MQAQAPQSIELTTLRASAQLAELMRLNCNPDFFWTHYLKTLGQALSARRVLLLTSAVGRPWQARSQWPATGAEQTGDPDWALQMIGQAKEGLPYAEYNADDVLGLAMTLPTGADASAQVLVVVALDMDVALWEPQSLTAWGALAAAVPAQWQLLQSATQPAAPASTSEAAVATAPFTPAEQSVVERAERLHDIFRLSIRLHQETRFMALAMALCNSLALRFGCERVAMGWVDGDDLQLTAVSHVENFDAKSQASRALEAVMEEALDQEIVLTFPAEAGTDDHVLRAHQTYCDNVGATRLTTVPLAHGERIDAVLCLERQAGALTPAELWELTLIGESLARWLSTLHDRDRWFGARWRTALQRHAATFLKPRHTAIKLAVAVAVVMLAVLTLLPWSYRVDAALAIRSQDLLFMPAPFDGYLRKVHVQVGDQVQADTVLVELDTRDLALEASMSEADWVRHSRESEKAMAASQLAEMQISAARALQSAARLEMIRHQLAHAQVRAPYAGVVIEGDLQKNLGAPVRKGDLLLKLAQTTNAYIELEIDQALIHEVKVGSRGEFSLVGRPEERFGITLKRIDPAAVTRDGRTFYLARADVDGAFRPNWRPGMGGNAKINAGDRSPLWIMTHRTVRFLREFFWL